MMQRVLDGWKLIIRVLWSVLQEFLKMFELLFELIGGKKEGGSATDCFNQPNLRAQPDPYI